MNLRVLLKTGDLIGSEHKELTLSSTTALHFSSKERLSSEYDAANFDCNAGQEVVIRTVGGKLKVICGSAWRNMPSAITVNADNHTVSLRSSRTDSSPAKGRSVYRGTLLLQAINGAIRVVLLTDLESYVQGVLQSEVPAAYDVEAMKAQAVLARTYGLRPRLPHTADNADVCDSYLHCQAFYGVKALTADQSDAIASTKGQILSYQGKPALALFSACAGGHTENYENCFSDPITNAFPPPPISYLKGVPEGKLPVGYPSEDALRKLYDEASPQTDDAWSKGNFRWQVRLPADAMEATMHHVVEALRQDPQFGPFIHPPRSEKFGHINKFSVPRRGVAGTAIELVIHTSSGDWRIEKELTIRSVFGNPELKLKRLKSARVIFDHANDSLGLLSTLTVRGFGSGHGVGLQQVGAQGLAKSGLNYRQIIEHYYHGAEISQVT